MKRKFWLFLPVIGMFLLACGKEEEGSVNIRIKLMYGDQPFEMFKVYQYPVGGEDFRMNRLSFFISDFTLRSSGGDQNILDIDYLDLTASHTDPVAPNGLEYRIENVKAGTYAGFDFGIGVPATENAKSPSDFPPSSILSGSAEYWASWKSYIFFRPEGNIALDGKPIGETDFALHLGADQAYRKITYNRGVTVKEGETTNIDIVLDIKKYFNGKTLYDIHDTQQIHSLFQMPLITQLADNLAVSFR